MTTPDAFADLLQANATHAEAASGEALPARAARGLALVTCMDPRIDPLAALGLAAGDAVVLRNPGGRVTDDVLDALVLGRHLLGCERVLVLQHTGCKMAAESEDAVHAAVAEAGGPDTRSLSYVTAGDQRAEVQRDVQRVRSSPYLNRPEVAGGIYDLATGHIELVG